MVAVCRETTVTGSKGYSIIGAVTYRAVSMGLKLSRLPLVGPLIDRVAVRKRLKVVTIPATGPAGIVAFPVGSAIKSDPAVIPLDAARRLVDSALISAVTDVCLCRESHGCRDLPDRARVLFLGKGAKKIGLHGRVHLSTKEDAVAHLGKGPHPRPDHGRHLVHDRFHAIGADPRSTVELCSCCPCCCLRLQDP